MNKNKKSKSTGERTQKPGNYQAVLAFFKNHPRTPFNYKQVAHRLKSNTEEVREEVEKILSILHKEDIIEEVSRGKFRYVPMYSIFTGKVDMTSRGTAFVFNEDLEQDIRINPALTGKAFNGDQVAVELLNQKKGSRLEGRIVEIIERARTHYVGTVQKMKKFAFVIPDSAKIHVDFFIPKGKLKEARDGDKVLVELVDWPDTAEQPVGKVVEVLGKAGEHETEMHAIISEFGFETKFDPRSIKESLQFPDIIPESEIKMRKDMRETLTLTIDPVDAKDFDDAISFAKLDTDRFEIGVHIADVSYYVAPGTALDDEAFERGTSVYLVDRTIPMLPERLSNNLCSLKPHVDRLAFSVLFQMNSQAKLLDYWIGKTVIHSDRRFAYEEAQEVIEGKSKELDDVIPFLNDLALILRQRRFDEGSISFESNEYKFDLDEKGAPIGVHKKIRVDAHKMIEEYMLLANKTIAKHVSKKMENKTLPYRVHAEPNPEKLEMFVSMAKRFGYVIDRTSLDGLAKSINKMVAETEGKPEASILHPLAIRSMEKAYYTSKLTSHFGLGFEYYTHFTSPIRRYPDLMVHRYLFSYLNGAKAGPVDKIETACQQSSKQEQLAVKAERASVKFKQTEYLSQFVGEDFNGTISGVTEWGLYVELTENYCEGMVRIKDIAGDYFEYYDKDLALIGRRTKKKYTLGDAVRIKIKRTNIHKRTVDFILVNN